MGNGWQANAAGFRQGRIALREITLFDTRKHRVRSGGEVKMPADLPPDIALGPRHRARLDRAAMMLVHAGAEATGQAGWKKGEAERTPISLGTSAGAMALGQDYFRQAVTRPGVLQGQTQRIVRYLTESQGLSLAEALSLRGPVTIVSNACASGANAIGQAFRLVKAGRAERVLAGGYDALCQLVFSGFDSLQALTPSGLPRPFDVHRDGLALGEGAAVVAVEALEAARARGADILGEIVGYGATTDLHHLTQPHPDGDAAFASMSAACAEAGLGPPDIDYINSHGTGTPLNDIAEGRAIQRWAGDQVGRMAVSSTKASIGHLLGGAGAVEAVISLMALRGNWLPPTTTVENPDSVCTFDLVRVPRDADVRAVLTNSFGFGGANATLVMRKIA